MKTVLLSFAFIALTLFGSVLFNTEAQQATPTPIVFTTPTPQNADYIYAVLLDNNALLYCSIIRQPIDPIFQTATAAASITLTVTKTPFPATWTAVPTSTTVSLPPSQESTPQATINATATPITMTVFASGGLNVRSCPAGANPSTSCSIVRLAGNGTYVQATGITYDGGSIEWRKLTDGNWIAEFINGVRVLGQ